MGLRYPVKLEISMAASLRWILVGTLAVPLLAHAQVYRWVSESGATMYGNRPPPNAARIVRLDVDSPDRTQMEVNRGSALPTFAPAAPGVLSSVDRATVEAVARSIELRRGVTTAWSR